MNFIKDNLIAEGKAVPMIIVNDNGYATAKDAPATPAGFSARDMTKMAETLEKVYVQEIIPGIDNLQDKARREYRQWQDYRWVAFRQCYRVQSSRAFLILWSFQRCHYRAM
jgi:hypothetical protein